MTMMMMLMMMTLTGVTVVYSSQADLQLLEPWSQVSKLLSLHSRQVVVQLAIQLGLVLLYALLQLLYVALNRLQPRLLLLQLLAQAALLLSQACQVALQLCYALSTSNRQP